MGQWATRSDHEYQARRTSIAQGQDSIYFRVNRDWFGTEAKSVRLFVTFHDNPRTSWHIEYAASNGLSPTEDVVTSGKDQWRTACFEISDMQCDGELTGRMDFRLVVTGDSDAVVRMVRIVKWPLSRGNNIR